jgi:hypothetical protein
MTISIIACSAGDAHFFLQNTLDFELLPLPFAANIRDLTV